MRKGLFKTKKKEREQKGVYSFARCLGRPQQTDIQEDQSTMMHHQLDQAQAQTEPQIQASCLVIADQQEHPDEAKPRTELIEEIVEHLKVEDVYKVVLQGKHGVGKTWIAKEVMKDAIFKNIVDVTIWVNFNQDSPEIDDKWYENYVFQLSVQEDHASAEYHLPHESWGGEKILATLKRKLEGRRYLLVMNIDNPETSERIAMQSLEKMLEFGNKNSSKILLTKLAVGDTMTTNDDIIGNNSNKRTVVIEVEPLTLSESKELLQRNWNNDHIVSEDDVEKIVKRCNYLPAAIVFTGNVLLHALNNAPDDLTKKLAIAEAKKYVDNYWMLDCCSGYNKFTNNVTLLRCFWLSWVYLKKHESINYNVLIMYWILEGYLDSTTLLEKAYLEGHNILTDLLDLGFLGEREFGDVVLERAALNFASYIFPDICEEPRLKYPCIFEKFDVRGKVERRDGSIALITREEWGDHDSLILETLILQGNDIFKEDKRKENNMIFNGITTKYSRPPIVCLSQMEFVVLPWMDFLLKVLILRHCDLKIVNELEELSGLFHLEISESCSFMNIKNDLFAKFRSLESLNLSGTAIKSFPRPSSRTSLSELKYLIMRNCSQLVNFPDVNDLEKLEVLDLFGSKFDLFDGIEISNFEQVPKLKMLDLSETNIEVLSGLMNLQNLTHLLVKNCQLLKNIEPLTTLTKLEVIDASGSSKLGDFELPNSDCLRKLDLSSTLIRTIHPLKNVSNLIYLRLNGCCQLKELPRIEGAKKLRVLDVSDAIRLEKINASFQEMESLQELFLSNTKLKTLPPLSRLESLRKLILKGCESLQSLPEMDSLINLVLVDLRGCNALETWLDDEQFSDVIVLKS